ncbi:hypothetical protein NUW58_g4293 [Xylaria curta]|uniref:Uncharacterized protein n=1 Tax=Xylaria curta TaxID=42375 RepID=A0ACC1P702_9PEZI|nr:hypothetical protein NUW58_g4293 [Xylaria curta]
MPSELWENPLLSAQVVVLLVFTALGTVVTLLRFVATHRAARKPGLEDWLAAVATISAALANISSLKGSGIIIWPYIAYATPERPSDYQNTHRWNIAALFLYFGHMLSLKYSVLALYYRVFGVNQIYRTWIYVLAGVQLIIVIVPSILIGVECNPLGIYNDQPDLGPCRDNGLIVIVGEVPNSIIDFALVILALFMIRPLQLSPAMKFKLRILFGLGVLYVFTLPGSATQTNDSGSHSVGILGFVKIAAPYAGSSVGVSSIVSLSTAIQMFISLHCCCLPVYKSILPSAAFWGNLSTRIASYLAFDMVSRSRTPKGSHGTSNESSSQTQLNGHRRDWIRLDEEGSEAPAWPLATYQSKTQLRNDWPLPDSWTGQVETQVQRRSDPPLPLSFFLCAQIGPEEYEGSVLEHAILSNETGAGAAGSSAAYYLRRYADELDIPINITVFEKTSRIGGRTLTVNVYDDPTEPVELGASIFVDVNYILANATRDFGLTTKDPGCDERGLLGIWNGDSFVYTQDSNSWDWVNLARLFWKYGTAPYHTYRLVQSTVTTFLKLYEEPFFPFRSLSTRAFQLDLAKITGVTGRQFLAANNLDGPFAHDIVQASTRVNYASNLEFIHGLGTMVALAPQGAKAIEGGNWQIFANMVNASRADVRLKSAVTDITLDANRKYRITAVREPGGKESIGAQWHPIAFDDVVIATPFQFANITTGENLIQHPIDTIPYATLHRPTSPISVLTTLGPDEEALPGQSGAGKAGFYSATLQRIVMNPRTHNPEYVYKIFSPKAVTPYFLSKLLGVEIPKSFTRDNGEDEDDATDDSVVSPISWFHATVFNPYPQKYPRVTFQDPILGNRLYYTSGIESFISTMETSALMGMNVARLIINDHAGIRPKEEELGAMHVMPKFEEGQQNVLEKQQKTTAEHYGRPAEELNEL